MRYSKDVSIIQEILNKLNSAKLIVDGYKGVQTEKAIKLALEGGEVTEPLTQPHSEHFKFSEFTCHDGTEVPEMYWDNLQKNMNMLEILRTQLGNNPITVISGYRTPTYNESIGGATNSQHMFGSASDIKVENVSPANVYNYADILYTNGGVGKYPTFTHVDVRGHKSRW